MLLNITECCELLKVSRSTFNRIRYAKGFPKPAMVGFRPRWIEEDLIWWVTRDSPKS